MPVLENLQEASGLNPSKRNSGQVRSFNQEQYAGARYSRKKLQIVICLLSVELCERFTYFGIVCNMILFCTLKLGYRNYQAAIVNLCFVGACTLSPVLVGWFADSCMGRTKVVYICALLHFIGTILLPAVAFPFEDFYIDTHQNIDALDKGEQTVLFYIGLLSASLGSGGIRAVVCPFSAYLLQEYDQSQLRTFFNCGCGIFYNYMRGQIGFTLEFEQNDGISNSVTPPQYHARQLASVWNSGQHLPNQQPLLSQKDKDSKSPPKPRTILTWNNINVLLLSLGESAGIPLLTALFHWFVSLNSAVVFVGIAYIQQSIAKNLGFLIPFASILMTLLTIHMVQNRLIYRPKSGGSLMTFFGVLVNAIKMCCVRYRHISGDVSNWLDRAKENYGGWYSEAHVNNVKCLFRLIPLFAFQILYRVCILQIPSAYFIQTMHSNLNLRGFLLPIAALNVIGLLPVLLLAPFLEYLGACLQSVRRDPLSPSPLAQMVIGHLCAVLSIVVAGISEVTRRNFLLVEQTLSGKVLLVSSMPCFRLAPQYLLLGISEALVTPACMLITFRLSPKSVQGIAMQFMTLFNGSGCFVGAMIIQTVYQVSGGNWFPNNLNVGNLDTFFFLLAAFMLLNILGLWRISHRYKDLQQEDDQCVKGVLLEKLMEHEKSLKFYDSVLDWPTISYPKEIVL